MQFINSFLNSITMYRLMLYYLLFLMAVASVLSLLQILPYSGLDILITSFYLVLVCKLSNQLLAKKFSVKTNIESSLITGLILSLILGPVNWIPAFAGMTKNLLFLTAVGSLAMVSKYVLAWKGKHIFNPAAFGALASALVLNQGASWWVGTSLMLPAVLLGGLLVLKKIRRYELVGTFFLVYLFLSLSTFHFPLSTFFSSPIFFFSLVMLVEPLTLPTTKMLQILFGAVVAAASFVIPMVLPDAYYGLELSLLVGNIFSYMVSRGFRQSLTLKEKKQLTHDVVVFLFEPARKFQFSAGQYLEWTLSHPNSDNRGVRRFFTIASSPSEDFIMLASKFYEKPSSFKQALHKMEPGDEIGASHLSGEFTLPDDTSKKLVFIAGGIGVTPFRSMVKWMIDKGEKRDIVLLFSNKTEQAIVFKGVFDAAKDLGVRTVYVNTDKMGYIDEAIIKKEVPDFKERVFYVSGPEPMVEAFEKMIGGMGIAKGKIKRDYFPGYSETHQK